MSRKPHRYVYKPTQTIHIQRMMGGAGLGQTRCGLHFIDCIHRWKKTKLPATCQACKRGLHVKVKVRIMS